MQRCEEVKRELSIVGIAKSGIGKTVMVFWVLWLYVYQVWCLHKTKCLCVFSLHTQVGDRGYLVSVSASSRLDAEKKTALYIYKFYGRQRRQSFGCC